MFDEQNKGLIPHLFEPFHVHSDVENLHDACALKAGPSFLKLPSNPRSSMGGQAPDEGEKDQNGHQDGELQEEKIAHEEHCAAPSPTRFSGKIRDGHQREEHQRQPAAQSRHEDDKGNCP